jgi:hypothetical protein
MLAAAPWTLEVELHQAMVAAYVHDRKFFTDRVTPLGGEPSACECLAGAGAHECECECDDGNECVTPANEPPLLIERRAAQREGEAGDVAAVSE